MEESAPASLVAAPEKRSAIKGYEYSLLCWLRLNPEVAETYGIKACTGKTTIGSMLAQTLESPSHRLILKLAASHSR